MRSREQKCGTGIPIQRLRSLSSLLEGLLSLESRRVSRAKVLSVMATGHCFVLSSLYEGTPAVVVEALAHGLTVICLGLFGMKDAVNAESGVKIPPNRLDQVIRDFAKAIEALWLDEDRRYQIAIAPQESSQRLTWKHKERVINEVYSRILPEMYFGSGQPTSQQR